MQIKSLALDSIKFGQEIKAKNAILMDVRGLTAMTDFFVIMSAENNRQVEAISENIKLSFKEDHEMLVLAEEKDDSNKWILLDYGDFIVHIFLEETREYYDLERLWGDAEITEVI